MPELKPLEEFYCDTCGLVANIKTAYLAYSIDAASEVRGDFKIVHNTRDCLPKFDTPNDGSANLSLYVGPDGLAQLTDFMSDGIFRDPNFEHDNKVKSLGELSDLIRRLHIPHYEEARQKYSSASEAVDLPNSMYTQHDLKRICEWNA